MRHVCLFALVAGASGLSCRTSAPLTTLDAGVAQVVAPLDDGAIGKRASEPCLSFSFDDAIRIEPIPRSAGFVPIRWVVSGAGTLLSLFPVEASGEGSDALQCAEIAIDAGIGVTEVRLQCQDGSQAESATVRQSGDRLDVDTVVDGTRTHQNEQVKPCARLVPGDATIDAPALEDDATNGDRRGPSGPECPDTSTTRMLGAFLRRGKMDPASHALPLWIEIPALSLRRALGEASGDDLCESVVSRHGWAYLQCGVGEDALYMRIVPRPGEVIVTRSRRADPPRVRIPLPCDVRLVLHGLPCAGDCPTSP